MIYFFKPITVAIFISLATIRISKYLFIICVIDLIMLSSVSLSNLVEISS